MANMCSNTVWFKGPYEKLKPLYDLLVQYNTLWGQHEEIDLTHEVLYSVLRVRRSLIQPVHEIENTP